MSTKPQRPESLSGLSKELGLSFPPSTRLLGVQRESGMDDAVFVKLEMSKREFPEFFAKTPIDRDRMGSGARGMLGSDLAFWDPHKAVNLRTGQAQLEGARVLNIGVDESRPDVVVLYVMEHGT